MTENPQKKKPLIIDSTESSASLEVATPSATSESLSSPIEDASISK